MKSLNRIFLRRANFSDIEFLWHLRNQPDVYKYSKNDRPVTLKEHVKWFFSMLEEIDKKKAKLFIIQKSGLPVGQIRFNYENPIKARISISVLRQFRKKGFAHKGLELSINKLKKENKIRSLMAIVHKKNIPSQKLFENLNFELKQRKGIWLTYSFKL